MSVSKMESCISEAEGANRWMSLKTWSLFLTLTYVIESYINKIINYFQT